ncbi:unnamed protein product [Cuscuta epithymum]|uniref:RNA polymerase II subunit 5-mediating protein homolog n=1 Tax=Cuscuta epithymum TaxID=186058 RepID=A0AAV0DE99_9ASTE|nr:unnamed protein product [Cuscuta epithymum]
MGEPVKGTVTSLSSLIPVDEAQKALQRVHEAVAERRKQMDQLNGFVAENRSLIDLVQRLPDKLHHDIMVPFGKAAFFPGRLIHTNEFMVLLGEGYYAERSSKQTSEILTRRGKDLESQVQHLKAVMQDLEAEASFFDKTASESAEGLVEIREDIVEESSYRKPATPGVSNMDSSSFPKEEDATQKFKDEEYAQILARIAELEKEEEEAEKANEISEDESGEAIQMGNSEVCGLSNMTKAVTSLRTESNEVIMAASRNHDLSKAEGSNGQAQLPKGEYFHEECLPFCQTSSTSVAPKLPVLKDNIAVLESKQAAVNRTEEHFDASKAFTGSIVEHSPNIDMQPSVGRASKPVSRFKMQRK